MASTGDGNVSMRVLMLTREYPPHVYGGAGVVVDHLSRALAGRAGVEVRCFGGEERSEHGLRVRGYPSWDRLAGSPTGDARYAPALEALSTDLLMARDPVDADVVHSHTWYVALAGLLVRTLFDIPLVVTLHSLEPSGPGRRSSSAQGTRCRAGRSAWPWSAPIGSSPSRRRCARTCSLISPSTPSASGLFTTASDTGAFRRTERRDALDRHGVRAPYVLFVGRISEQKGIFHLLEAAAGLPGGHPARPVRQQSRHQ